MRAHSRGISEMVALIGECAQKKLGKLAGIN
jgi:hypothetical protein